MGWCLGIQVSNPLLTPVILPGEPGLLVAPVSQQSPFLGYAGAPELAQGKLLRDVFWPGDVFFNTGDLLVCDEQGFLHFHDRTGDTFRYLCNFPLFSDFQTQETQTSATQLYVLPPHPMSNPIQLSPPTSLSPQQNAHNACLSVSHCSANRWKGENVATTEVAEVLEALDFLQEVNVYGVTVPGA